MVERCENCRYFDGREEATTCIGEIAERVAEANLCLGTCRAELPLLQEHGFGVWPVVTTEDWCGQFQPEGLSS